MKRVYVVETPFGVKYVRAHSQQGAIHAIASNTMTARPAKVEDVIGLHPSQIIETGADAAQPANVGGEA